MLWAMLVAAGLFCAQAMPDAVLQVVITYHDFTGTERGVPNGTPVNLYLDGHKIATDESKDGQAYFEVAFGNYVMDAVLGRADKTRWWVCRKGMTVNEPHEFQGIECEKVFFLFYPFITPSR